ncbi:DUF397 domain-containing protein [Streptomyces sp. GC420]|uniref:DUF397 domain-containing protein n=1 Tax=Streptomyces sp. GC420 TaxID=2697568 RepID=UPI0014151CE2|nr:DUF397 domain-containing protein [Streptomyces sp. GC420]NBM17234.1 DUF397 domain-containing protein [Streptomyces sp. GC420]
MSTEQNNSPSRELTWFKSSYSGPNGGDCVEVAAAPRAVHVRDSKDLAGTAPAFSREQWAAFTAYARETPVS